MSWQGYEPRPRRRWKPLRLAGFLILGAVVAVPAAVALGPQMGNGTRHAALPPPAPTDAPKPVPPQQTIPEPDLSELDRLVRNGPGRVNVAVLQSSDSVLYEDGGHQRHMLASVVKVYILLAFLDQVAQEQRAPTAAEDRLMQWMIQVSDNDSATVLWNRVGGIEGIQHFLAAKDLPAIQAPARPGFWGETMASPLEVAALLTALVEGRLLDPYQTSRALQLLSGVEEEQAWGVGAARGETGLPFVYLKNGWYPEPEGWVVNSAGIVAGRTESYIVVVLSDYQPSFEDAVTLIEEAVQVVRARLL